MPFLEKELNCPALHLPMGQSSVSRHGGFFINYWISAELGCARDRTKRICRTSGYR